MREPARITYVDDEQDLCEIFLESLEHCNFELSAFTSPEKAAEAARTCAPDVVIIDYRLPNTTGDKVALQFPKSAKFILLTGEINVASEFAFDRIVFKPIDFSSLELVIRALLSV